MQYSETKAKCECCPKFPRNSLIYKYWFPHYLWDEISTPKPHILKMIFLLSFFERQTEVDVLHEYQGPNYLSCHLLPSHHLCIRGSWNQEQNQVSNLGTLIWDASIPNSVLITVPNARPSLISLKVHSIWLRLSISTRNHHLVFVSFS